MERARGSPPPHQVGEAIADRRERRRVDRVVVDAGQFTCRRMARVVVVTEWLARAFEGVTP